MKKKLLLAGAAMLLAAAAVTGFSAYNKTNVPDLLSANVEALAKDESSTLWQDMAYCQGSIRLVCTCDPLAYGCSTAYCINC